MVSIRDVVSVSASRSGDALTSLGPSVPVSWYTEYWDTATNLSGINTSIEVTQ